MNMVLFLGYIGIYRRPHFFDKPTHGSFEARGRVLSSTDCGLGAGCHCWTNVHPLTDRLLRQSDNILFQCILSTASSTSNDVYNIWF